MNPITKDLLATKEPFLLITGPAGSGKTFIAREAINMKPKFALLTATTGAASRVLSAGVNSEVKTIHTTVGFFDADSLRNSRKRGTLRKNLKRLKRKYKRIIIDEASMLDCEVFEILVAECEAVGMGLIIIADFLQLPSIPPKCYPAGWTQWIFNTPSFSKFKVIRLATQYRQKDPEFIAGLNLLRAGRGVEAMPHLKAAGVKFVPGVSHEHPLDLTYNGTTIVGTNEFRGLINTVQYNKIDSPEEVFKTTRTGHWSTEDWQEWDSIPDSLSLKIGARVMVLRNLYGFIEKTMHQVDTDVEAVEQCLWRDDGSGGYISNVTDPVKEMEDALLQANGDTGVVERFTDEGVFVRRDDGALLLVSMMKADNGLYHTEIDPAKGRRIRIVDQEATAWVDYLPLTQAWALTVHKSQGLTIDHATRVVCESFFSKPAMMYVACSRVKNPKDLTIVGAEDVINEETRMHWLCNTDGHCEAWL